MKPNFDSMSQAELRKYVLNNTEDLEAFNKLVDRLQANSQNQVWHPFSNSTEEQENISKLIQSRLEKLEQK